MEILPLSLLRTVLYFEKQWWYGKLYSWVGEEVIVGKLEGRNDGVAVGAADTDGVRGTAPQSHTSETRGGRKIQLVNGIAPLKPSSSRSPHNLSGCPGKMKRASGS